MRAANGGHVNLVRFFLNIGADVEEEDSVSVKKLI
jgi:hypothetical protein